MTLAGRLKRIEHAVGSSSDHCPTCGYPDTAMWILTGEEDEHERCATCDRELADNGRPVKDGRVTRVLLGERY